MPEINIRNIYLHLTKRCNLRCSYCYFDAGEPMAEELSSAELCGLFRDIVSIKPDKVVFTGGEPLLRKDIFLIAGEFSRISGTSGIKLCLMSNGMLVDHSNSPKIAAAFDEVRISLDGPPEINDRLRGEGVFESASRAIRLLRMEGIRPAVSITANSQNIGCLEEFLVYVFENLYTSDIHISPFRPVGRGSANLQLDCCFRDVQSKISDFWRKRFGGQQKDKDILSSTLLSCGNCGIGSHINILPDGSVYPCHVLSTPEFLLGTLRKSNLLEIVKHSDLLKRLRSLDIRKTAMDSEFKALTGNSICLGEMYRDAPHDVRKLLFTQA